MANYFNQSSHDKDGSSRQILEKSNGSHTVIKLRLSDFAQDGPHSNDRSNEEVDIENSLDESDLVDEEVSQTDSGEDSRSDDKVDSSVNESPKSDENSPKEEEEGEEGEEGEEEEEEEEEESKSKKNDFEVDELTEEKNINENDKLNLKDSETEKTRKYIRHNKLAKITNIKEDFSTKFLSEEEKLKLALESGVKFNDRVILNRIKIKEHMKKMERQKQLQRTPLENTNIIFPSNYVPLFLYDEHMNEFYDLNGTIQVEKTTLEKFINYNVAHEHSHGIPEQYNRLGFYHGRRFQKRRRRRTTKLQEDNNEQ